MKRRALACKMLLATMPAAAQVPGEPSMLVPHGRQAAEIAQLYWWFLGVSTVVWVLVTIALLLALRRRRTTAADPLDVNEAGEQRSTVIVAICVAFTTATVLVLTGMSYLGQRALASAGEPEITIRVTGRQWWWELRYENDDPSRILTTANEMHIPVGAVVRLQLASADVIHSFFVPNLAGKQDLVPSRQNELVIVADRPGIYRGACAEYCGYQHAHMGFVVVAEPREAFDAWMTAQLRPAEPPDNELRQRGLEVFTSRACVMCHAVRGTTAAARVGPDLTHLFSRRTLAAGTLPLTRGTLAAWISDPQSIKPGANMPAVPLEPAELNALLSFLEGLR